MTSERLGEMFKGDSADISACVDGGTSGHLKRAQTGNLLQNHDINISRVGISQEETFSVLR